jgi:hypothetical protein
MQHLCCLEEYISVFAPILKLVVFLGGGGGGWCLGDTLIWYKIFCVSLFMYRNSWKYKPMGLVYNHFWKVIAPHGGCEPLHATDYKCIVAAYFAKHHKISGI